ncbi:hypothetical protein GF357_01150 [Candidatus Dojkabacteria bacterium]|nr:hypothetical protein [Candidatus Dojkabacteria bacterium]
MKIVDADPFKSGQKNVEDNLPEGESVLYEFEVIPLDYAVTNYASPVISVSQTKLILYYDNKLEIYDLDNIELEYYGDPPKFTMWQQILEGRFTYNPYAPEDLVNLKNFERISKMSLNEVKKPPKDFILRKGQFAAKSYQTWAMVQIIKDSIAHKKPDPMLYEMIAGNFTNFNSKPLLLFILAFIAYLILKLIVGLGLPDILGIILDVGFALGLVFIAVWVFLSQEKNNKAFLRTYLKYQQELELD